MSVKIVIPDKVEYILQKLNEKGYEGYVVGGCIRDSILGRPPKDWDIASNALPSDVVTIFGVENTIPTGIKYGTVTVILSGESFEVTTYRIDMGYSDFRRPDEIKFTSSIKEELGRRDFTINAMAYNRESGLIDLFGGLNDIERKMIRCVGNPDDRFSEDALRMVRVVRFAAQLGFQIDGKTLSSINKNSSILMWISSERIMVELDKSLVSDFPQKIEFLFSSGLMEYIIPAAWSLYNIPGGAEKLCRAIDIIKCTVPLVPVRMAVLLYCLGIRDRGETLSVLKKLRYDNSTINKVCCLIENYEENVVDDMKYIRHMLHRIGRENFANLIDIKMAEFAAEGRDFERQRAGLALDMMDDAVKRGECYSLRNLSINGKDLMEAGFSGRDVGNVLKYLLEAVMDEPEINCKEKLMQMAGQYRKDESDII